MRTNARRTTGRQIREPWQKVGPLLLESQVMFTNSIFYSRDRKNRTEVCLTWTGVSDIGDRLARVLKGESMWDLLCVAAKDRIYR